ncbi:recombinase RecU [Alkalihalobacillus alcalophilus ATCC 27647 = CGMCC 1.3604]|uniref:Holliday junction resolvase RecU n=1 Tax=Alkalihalobacillus alcalophilus ATCC 27647 = CGMCC 1.3604 TaxID=1218173 RepID=A0A094WSP2_ALKAL|nr:Holliday junction resolvase RecU [Alkalihalobacillus alcalophilus]KGA99098.1 Holliday junction resolvase [Alkalihalobacillus alcalophilus ATCC 27647 = CGMCC 1.3604]MED1563479.1 Holliday junction resolvase RecU [Alkalihalobacillus alcalophilus]THG90299.1 recombinase RecU [Alkalihalobacillus alcalophilus ATCC 27647 = CGMCC 1.3604]
MTIRYPNGKVFKRETTVKNQRKTSEITYSNRGMSLEDDINETNEYYLQVKKAVIHKKPTPVQIVQVDYPKRSAAVIKEAYFKQASTTDYNGVYKGRYIDFEAKETKNKTSFPLQNFHEHQIQHMQAVLDQEGIAFILIRFSITDQVFLLDASYLITCYLAQKNGRKSIPKKEIEKCGHLVKIGYQPRIDYLTIVEQLYFS